MFDHIDIRADARVASFNRLITLPLHITLQTVYSRLFSLHDMGPDVRYSLVFAEECWYAVGLNRVHRCTGGQACVSIGCLRKCQHRAFHNTSGPRCKVSLAVPRPSWLVVMRLCPFDSVVCLSLTRLLGLQARVVEGVLACRFVPAPSYRVVP